MNATGIPPWVINKAGVRKVARCKERRLSVAGNSKKWRRFSNLGPSYRLYCTRGLSEPSQKLKTGRTTYSKIYSGNSLATKRIRNAKQSFIHLTLSARFSSRAGVKRRTHETPTRSQFQNIIYMLYMCMLKWLIYIRVATRLFTWTWAVWTTLFNISLRKASVQSHNKFSRHILGIYIFLYSNISPCWTPFRTHRWSWPTSLCRCWCSLCASYWSMWSTSCIAVSTARYQRGWFLRHSSWRPPSWS